MYKYNNSYIAKKDYQIFLLNTTVGSLIYFHNFILSIQIYIYMFFFILFNCIPEQYVCICDVAFKIYPTHLEL